MGPNELPSRCVVAVVALALGALAGCRIAAEPEQIGQPTAEADPVASAAAAGAPPAQDELVGGIGVESIDFDDAVYASACGLSWLEVSAGVGEASRVDGVYGMEVVAALTGDLDGTPGAEAVVLVDCLGGDTYSPHVLGITAADVSSPQQGSVVVLPSTGASLAAGHRPVAITTAGEGTVEVELEGPGGPVRQELDWAPHVMAGGELAAEPGSEVHGVIVGSEPDGVIVVSLAPGIGYRLKAPPGLTAIDPDTDTALTVDGMVGRPSRIVLDGSGAVASIELLPGGAA